MFAAESVPVLLAGLAVGLVFGFLLQKGQVSKYPVIVGQFLLVDFTVAKVMFTAIAVGSVGTYALLQLGLIDGLIVKPALLAGVAVGGLIFGVGMTGFGYCPGTGVAAAGEGSKGAAWGVLGMVVGAGLYAHVYPLLDHTLLTVWDYGKVTLPEVLHVPPWVLVVALAFAAAGVFAAITRWERRQAA